MRRRVPDEPACERCERPESYCTCPQEGDEAWCTNCGWSMIKRIEIHDRGYSAECTFCGEDMTDGAEALTSLPHDPPQVLRLIRYFLDALQDGRDFSPSLVALDVLSKRLPRSWRTSHTTDARALSSAADLLYAAGKALERLDVEMPR